MSRNTNGAIVRLPTTACFIGLLLWFSGAWASDPRLDVAQAEAAPVSLSRHFAVLEDSGLALTLEDVRKPEFASQFTKNESAKTALNFGLTKSAYWLRLHLTNSSKVDLDQLLEIAGSRLSSVDFYRLTPGLPDQIVNTGYFRPFANRAYPHRFFVFPVALAANSETVIYFRVESKTALEIPATLWKRSDFHTAEINDHMFQAAYFGMTAAMMLFNLLLWLFLKERSYLIYVLYVFFHAIGQAGATGLGAQFIWGDMPYWTTISFGFGSVMTAMFLTIFMRYLIDTATVVPRIDKMLKGVIAINLFAAAIIFVAYKIQLTLLVVNLSALIALVVATMCSFKGIRAAHIFLAAFMALLIGVLLAGLRIAGVVPTNFLTTNGIQLGTAIEMILLAFALADRFNVERAAKEKAQAEALDAQHQVVETLRTSERLLEGRVKERTAELSLTIDRLKQTQADLVQADKLASLGALVAGVAHELNTPIGTALTASSTLDEAARELKASMDRGEMRKSALSYFVDSTVPMAELISRSCKRAAALISSFKQVAVDQTTEQRRSFDLNSLVEDNVSALRPSYRSEPWVFEVHIQTGIECDSYPGPLGQVISNLVQNAVTHAFGGRSYGRLTITASAHGEAVEMIFEDDGKGMNESTLKHIFEPFFTTSFGKGGSGLGLSISLNIVSGVLGGTLHASSELGKGSRFVIRFPKTAPDRKATV